MKFVTTVIPVLNDLNWYEYATHNVRVQELRTTISFPTSTCTNRPSCNLTVIRVPLCARTGGANPQPPPACPFS
eukprot:scaffold599852_cov24-Prasinocladus_malaysianus.AAC.1